MARCQRRADHLQRRAGKGYVIAIERGALDDVAGADEARHEFGFRPRIDVFGRAELVDAAAIHHRDHVGRGHGLGLVVGDIDGGVAIFVVQPADFEPHLLAQIGVEVGQRLVEQQRLRFDDQRARQRHALLLPAGELAGIALRQRLELGRGQDRRQLLRNGVAVHLAQTQAVDDVFGHRHVRPQRVALEDHRHVALLGRQRARSSTTPAARRHGSRRRKVPGNPRSAAASWSCRSRTGRAGRRVVHDRSSRRHYRPLQANQIAWSGRATQPTPIVSLPRFGSCTDQRPAWYASIRTKT